MNLTTGTQSGLGRFIYEYFGGLSFDRSNSLEDLETYSAKNLDTIFHCAFNRGNEIDRHSLGKFLTDNVILTQELVKIPHKKFIFISTVDIYPKTKSSVSEDCQIQVKLLNEPYQVTKYISENIVTQTCKNYLIVRLSALLGKYSKPNSLSKIRKNENAELTLTPNSNFNYVLHLDVARFLEIAIQKDLTGIYNIASSENITISEVAKHLDKKVNFGSFFYNVGNVNNAKAASVYPLIEKTSRQVISEYLEEIP